jgi:hypothetical protein
MFMVSSQCGDQPNDGGVSAGSLSGPTFASILIEGGVIVSDTGNNRILEYPTQFSNSRFTLQFYNTTRSQWTGGETCDKVSWLNFDLVFDLLF